MVQPPLVARLPALDGRHEPAQLGADGGQRDVLYGLQPRPLQLRPSNFQILVGILGGRGEFFHRK